MPHDVLHAHTRKAPDMAGYAHDYSKSNNAINAEECGLMTATTIAAHLRDQGYKGVTAKAIHELVPAEEWHHSSKMYNRVNYYDPQVAEEYIKEGLEEWKARRKNATQPQTALGSISWKEWSGGARSRTFTEHTYSGEYEVKGDWLTFTYQGKRIRKKASGNSITVIENSA